MRLVHITNGYSTILTCTIIFSSTWFRCSVLTSSCLWFCWSCWGSCIILRARSHSSSVTLTFRFSVRFCLSISSSCSWRSLFCASSLSALWSSSSLVILTSSIWARISLCSISLISLSSSSFCSTLTLLVSSVCSSSVLACLCSSRSTSLVILVLTSSTRLPSWTNSTYGFSLPSITICTFFSMCLSEEKE